MINLCILLSMIFLHIKDDYNQGIIADLKCKDWWKKNEPDKKYRYDYIIVLLLHGFSWSFVIHLPIIMYYYFIGILPSINSIIFLLVLMGNAIIHGLVDHMTANARIMNLTIDQVIHICQIYILWYYYMIYKI